MKSTTVTYNDSYAFPTTAEQGFEHAKDFVGIAGSSATKTPGSTIDNVDRDMTFQIERQYTITIYNTDGTTVKDTFTVDEGDDQTLPDEKTTGYENVKEYIDGQNTYPLGYTFENVQEDIDVQVVPYNYYNVYIDNVQQQETVREGEGYTTPTDMPGVTKFIDTATHIEYNPGDTVPNIQADLYLEAVSVPTYTWKVDGQPGGTVPAGTEITLPNTAAIGYLLAYTDGEDEGVTDDLYKPSAKYTVNRNVNFISINEVSMQQTDKVSMYYKQGEDQRGMRFLGKLTVNEESDTNILSSDAFQTGMLICAEDTYYDLLGEDMTIEKAEQFEYLINAQNNSEKTRKWITGQPGSFACGIVDIKDYNIPRNFLSRGYVIVNYVDGDSQVVYGDPSTPRNVKWIATQVFNDKTAYDKLPSWKKEIVDYCKDYEEE
ncbi:MAG: hypothetical protein IJ883_04550 [Eubacterium sp.]|nr:hypothetical protein [Eubacterium sp.]